MSSFRIEFPAHILPRLAAFCSTDTTRVQLRGIFITPQHCVATDGHRLGVINAESLFRNSPNVTVTPTKELVAAAKTAIKTNRDSTCVLTGDAHAQTATFYVLAAPDVPDADRPNAVAPGHVLAGQFIQNTVYPDWQRVLPTHDPADVAPCGFNAGYLGDFAKTKRRAYERGGSTAFAGLYLSPNKHGCAWAFTNDADFVGVVMGLRMSSKLERPSWLPGAPAKAAAPQAAE